MLDADDIRIITQIVSNALAEERKHTEAMFADYKEEMHADMLAMFADYKEEMHVDMTAMFADYKEEMHADMTAMFADYKEEMHADMTAMFAQQKKEVHADMMTIIESEVTPKLRILAEGHEALLERITPPEEIESMKADIVILKDAVHHLSTRIDSLQKAQ